MTSYSITDTKLFMSQLLIKDTFDRFLVTEASISTANTFQISGSINRSFYSQEEWEQLEEQNYSFWGVLKPFCFSLIKGNKVPVSMKVVLMLSQKDMVLFFDHLSKKSDIFYPPENCSGLFVNIRYNGGTATLVTGVSLRTFSMDKTIEHEFDAYIRTFLTAANTPFEEI